MDGQAKAMSRFVLHYQLDFLTIDLSTVIISKSIITCILWLLEYYKNISIDQGIK
jgi:hypothetical protein